MPSIKKTSKKQISVSNKRTSTRRKKQTNTFKEEVINFSKNELSEPESSNLNDNVFEGEGLTYNELVEKPWTQTYCW